MGALFVYKKTKAQENILCFLFSKASSSVYILYFIITYIHLSIADIMWKE